MANQTEPTPTQHYWLEHLRACEASGQSLRAYAEQHALNRHSLQSGKAQLVRLGLWPQSSPPPKSRFLRVELSPPRGHEPHRLHLGKGLVLELAAHSEPVWLAQLLCALQRERP